MGLQDVFQKAAQTAITAFGDVIASAVYESVQEPEYDIASGEVTSQNTQHNIKLAFIEYTEQEKKDLHITTTDKKALLAGISISFTPKADDIIIDEAGVRWVVVEPEVDPSGALWTLRVNNP